MYTVEHHAGRLIEAKLASPLTLADVQDFTQKHLAVMARIPVKYIGVVNLLGAHVFEPAVAGGLTKLLTTAASHVERSAYLIGESAIFSLQVERVIRESNSPNRRAFRNGGELVTWMSEILTPAEQLRLERFIREALAEAPMPGRAVWA
ncbi:MAG: hypothetical protein ABI779_17530 [Acidobacteriota bacterium]